MIIIKFDYANSHLTGTWCQIL